MSIEEQFQQARLAKQGQYEVRTNLMHNGEPVYTNRLIFEDSPYLLQHAHNPVNWYPWGDEAFVTASAENKPIFLSIGYSTCHWCHVMEEESFDNEQVAELLNTHFISIKVDREQRPDLDEIYMTGVQLISGQGGWPMSSFLTSEGKPFYGATYFPPQQFMSLLQRIQQFWSLKREAIESDALSISNKIHQQLTHREKALEIGQLQINQALSALKENEDTQCGGFGNTPKFPNESNLLLLLDQLERDKGPLDENPLWNTLNRALMAMLQGGIYDQLAGGFHRYATDRHWLVPHFEKMLYNQAQLAQLFARTWRLSGAEINGNAEYRRICEETLDYVLREMRTEKGTFYSATDADSEGHEGKFFVWSWHELKQLLSEPQIDLLKVVYGTSKGGNFEGNNILFLPKPLIKVAERMKISYHQLLDEIDKVKQLLYPVRQKRPAPLRDEKVITEWNAMMIKAFAEAGLILNQTRYTEAAEQAALSIWDNSRDTNGLLLRIYYNGIASGAANLEDYSHYLQALIKLYDATANRDWLDKARQLWRQMSSLFWEPDGGGFYTSQTNTEGPLIVRAQPYFDGATPSGNAVALAALCALNERCCEAGLEQQINQLIARFSAMLEKAPMAMCYMLTGIAQRLSSNPSCVQYAAQGAIKVDAELTATLDNRFFATLDLNISSGWHINDQKAADKNLIATQVGLGNSDAAWTLVNSQYLPSSPRLGMGYQGHLRIQLDLERHLTNVPLLILMQLQACSDSNCLAPQQIEILLH